MADERGRPDAQREPQLCERVLADEERAETEQRPLELARARRRVERATYVESGSGVEELGTPIDL